jgi:hypothetical protein
MNNINPTFKGIVIGLLMGLPFLFFATMFFYSEKQTILPTPINPVNSNTQTREIIPTPSGYTNEKTVVNTTPQLKNIERKSKEREETSAKSEISLEQQKEIQRITALYRKYNQLEIELSERLDNLKEQQANLPDLIKSRLSQAYTEDEVHRISEETQNEAQRNLKQILKTNEELGLIRAKRELLPLNLIK